MAVSNPKKTFFLSERSGKRLEINQIELLEQTELGAILDLCLKFQVDWASYQEILQHQWFNLDPDYWQLASGHCFKPGQTVEVLVRLNFEALEALPLDFKTEVDVPYLKNLSQIAPDHPLLFISSWIGLSISQQHSGETTRYRSIFDYVDWQTLARAEAGDSVDECVSSVVKAFFTEALSGAATSRNPFEGRRPQKIDLVDTVLDIVSSADTDTGCGIDPTVKVASTVLTALEAAFHGQQSDPINQAIVADDTLTEPCAIQPELPQLQADDLQPLHDLESIFKSMTRFFEAERWSVTQVAGKPVLEFLFRGQEADWHCYVQAREAARQCVVYSVLPFKAREAQRLAVAEFITRANYGLLIGNFELDFDDGEIRYKTSLDVGKSQLRNDLIQPLISSNLSVTDYYFSGIMNVANGNISAADAIAQIEAI